MIHKILYNAPAAKFDGSVGPHSYCCFRLNIVGDGSVHSPANKFMRKDHTKNSFDVSGKFYFSEEDIGKIQEH